MIRPFRIILDKRKMSIFKSWYQLVPIGIAGNQKYSTLFNLLILFVFFVF